jgi:hypothetical protein
MSRLQGYEEALAALSYPTMAYQMESYGEPVSAATVALVTGGVSAITALWGKSADNKLAQAQIDQNAKLAREQGLMQASILQREQEISAQRAKMMPLYLIVAIGGVTVATLAWKR